MSGKKYKALQKEITAAMPVAEAVAFLQKNPAAKFDETVELHVRLGVDPQKSDQMVRSNVTLPGGAVKKKNIVVFTEDEAKQKAALEAGASQAGGEKLIAEIIKNGSLDADTTIASPDMMPKIAKVAKILGPKGLMPNPKTGTVVPEPAVAVKELLSGKLFFKMDNLGNIHEPIGKLSWDAEKITANATALIEAVKAARPATIKGTFVRSVVIKSTMSPAIAISL